ncbi:MAG: ABC transporter ATP-binding protein [Gammaproteobacteria bacterium]|nr:ABC transporter ATP-binding protein [Gammaproteobacteria bacterium]
MDTLLEVKNIECNYKGRPVIQDLSFNIKEGQIACLLGPSGCGKTTALRAIAGFEPVRKGEIILKGKTVSRPGFSIAPDKRKLGMVFQDYALFPHMDISDNIGFGLRDMSGLSRQQIANTMLKTVGLADMGHRYPHELSGGQQQRVALARALAPRPEMILMDEPFSNLDIEMREHLSNEVRDILKEQGITGILVTHDQNEAFAIGDIIGVISAGKLQQWDSAYNLYHEPANRFVADFIGQGAFLKGSLSSPESVETEIGLVQGNRAYGWPVGTRVDLLLRPDDILPDENSKLSGTVTQKAFKGAEILYTLELNRGIKVLSLFPSHHDHAIGEKVGIRIAADHMIVFPENDL